MQSLTRQALRALEIYADPAWAPTGRGLLADTAKSAVHASVPGSDHQLAWVHALLGSATSQEHLTFVRGLLDGSEHLDGLAVDHDLRWAMLRALCANGVLDEAAVAAELERDPSAAGQRHAATARALAPSPVTKAEAWRLAMHDDTLPNAMQKAVINGFAYPTQGELVVPYRQRYFDEIGELWSRRTSELAQSAVVGLFPTWTSTINADTVASADAFLAADDVPSALRRLVLEGRADVVRAMHAREADMAAG